jgi:hypothetical protein
MGSNGFPYPLQGRLSIIVEHLAVLNMSNLVEELGGKFWRHLRAGPLQDGA